MENLGASSGYWGVERMRRKLQMNASQVPQETMTYSSETTGVDWNALKAALADDQFDNGRSPEQLCSSFENSFAVCIARDQNRIVGTARVLSDGTCNAYLIDVWTQSRYRHRGIAKEMIRRLCAQLAGQHIYLQADDDIAEIYRRLGFRPQPQGMSMVVGRWLSDDGDECRRAGP